MESEGNRNLFPSQLPGKTGQCEEQLMLNIAKAKAVSHFCGYIFMSAKPMLVISFLGNNQLTQKKKGKCGDFSLRNLSGVCGLYQP